MSNADTCRFRYLNQDGVWPGLKTLGLEHHEDGALTLSTLPAAVSERGHAEAIDEPLLPAGIAVGHDGRVYFSDSQTNHVCSRDPCDQSITTVARLDEGFTATSPVSGPRGLAIHLQRNALLVADSGNSRIQLFALDSFQLVDVWKTQTESNEESTPLSLAVDANGFTYVVCQSDGSRQVQKLDIHGNELADFRENVQKHFGGNSYTPTELAVFGDGKETLVYLLDADRREVFVFDSNGRPHESINLQDLVTRPMGLLVTTDAIYVGDNGRQRIVKLRRFLPTNDPPRLVGDARGYSGWVAGLAVDRRSGTFWAHTGGNGLPVKLNAESGYVDYGLMWIGPVRVSKRPTAWHRLRALGDLEQEGTHIRLFVFTSSRESLCPVPPSSKQPRFETDPEEPRSWRPFPTDLHDVLVGESSTLLWIGARLEGDGLHSPRIDQIRVEYNHETYTQYLPEIYKTETAEPATLDRFLSLFESFFVDVEQDIDELACYFAPAAVPVAWLDWLAGWLGLGLNEEWSEDRKRRAIAKAFELYGRRGTRDGLRDAIEFFADVDAQIHEPLVNTDWWILPDEDESNPLDHQHSSLGINSRLIGAEPQGAVVGTTAVLDHSHLLRQEEFSAPLFEDTAHQFTVQVYQGQVPTKEKLNEVREIIEREKPAHTAYELCVIQPRLRIGFQATLGVDTVVGGEPIRPSRLDKDKEMILAGSSARLGHDSRIGQSIRLGPDGPN